MKKALLALVVVVGLLVGIDRIAVWIVTGVAADALKSSMNLSETPGLDIEGFPFLTQWASNDFDHVHVQFHDFQSTNEDGSPGVKYHLVDADLHGVRPENGFRSAKVSEVDGSVVIAYPDLSEAFNRALGGNTFFRPDFAVGSDPHTLDVTVLGGTTPIGVSLAPGSGNTLVFDLSRISGVPEGLINALPGVQDNKFQLPLRVPFGLTVTSLSIQPDGIHGSVSGTNVELSKAAVDSGGTAASIL